MSKKILGAIIAVLVIIIVVLLIQKRKMPVGVYDYQSSQDIAFDMPASSPPSMGNAYQPVVTPQSPQPTQPAAPSVPPCAVDYTVTAESKVVSEESPALITGFKKECDGNWYVAFDYLGPGNDNPDDDIGFYSNTNPKIRTFKVNPNLFVVLSGENNNPVVFTTYLTMLKKMNFSIFNQPNAYRRDASDGQPVLLIKVQNGVVVQMAEQYMS